MFYILKSLDEFKGWISLTNAKRGLPLKRHFDWTSESPIPPEIESQPQSVKWTCIRKCKNITKWSKNVRILTTLAWTTWILICHIPTYYYLFKTKSLCHASLGFGPALAPSNFLKKSEISLLLLIENYHYFYWIHTVTLAQRNISMKYLIIIFQCFKYFL